MEKTLHNLKLRVSGLGFINKVYNVVRAGNKAYGLGLIRYSFIRITHDFNSLAYEDNTVPPSFPKAPCSYIV